MKPFLGCLELWNINIDEFQKEHLMQHKEETEDFGWTLSALAMLPAETKRAVDKLVEMVSIKRIILQKLNLLIELSQHLILEGL